MPISTLICLFAIIVLAHTIETVTGFGCTIVALALGVYFVPVEVLVVTLVAIGWLQSAWLVARGFRVIRWRLFFTRILPGAALGFPVGIWAFGILDSEQLKLVLGGFVTIIAALELVRLFRSGEVGKPLKPALGFALLGAGGFFHGLFASGGPPIVYFTSREIHDKGAFRATLSWLWLLLNSTLLVTYAVSGRLDREPLELAAFLLPALVTGILAGEILHRRVNELAFKKAVQLLLLATGLMLLV
ncbi:MAG: uncharacterized protein QG656_2600 [Candidatus Hydrogenedentes bacterium]|nr:uncharacterized protein [Candidatus Hydrogenedentota bacterium]